jgi:hypothetical protein
MGDTFAGRHTGVQATMESLKTSGIKPPWNGVKPGPHEVVFVICGSSTAEPCMVTFVGFELLAWSAPPPISPVGAGICPDAAVPPVGPTLGCGSADARGAIAMFNSTNDAIL